MADLSTSDKLKLEKLLGMASGYVLDFSNRTFQEFVFDNVGVDIYDEKYNYGTGSKANRLRAFWNSESGYLVAKLLDSLLDYWQTTKLLRGEAVSESEEELLRECRTIVARVREGAPVEAINAIQPYSDDSNSAVLADYIRETISQDRPELGLDRLHTYTVSYVRHLCDLRGITYEEKTPLHGLFGRYVKSMRNRGLIKSEMTEKILKSTISVLEALNDVRNRHSLAHDNPLLSRDEAMLISSHVIGTIRFLVALNASTPVSATEGNLTDRNDDSLST